LIRITRKMKRIVSQSALKKGKLLAAQQDGSKEFIFLLACVSVARKRLPPLLIYQGESHDLMDTWLEGFEDGDEAWFAYTSNGWSCDKIGRLWLGELFERHTKL